MALTTSRAGGSKCSPVYACTANTLDLLSAGDGTSIMLLFFRRCRGRRRCFVVIR